MAIAWSRISSKVIAHPPYADAACRRRCGNGESRSGVCIPHMVDKRKQEVLGARDAEVTPRSQMRGGMCHVRLDRLPPLQTHTEARSALCPPPHDTSKNTRKPDSAAASKHTSASRETAARRNTPPRLSIKPSMIWGLRKTS